MNEEIEKRVHEFAEQMYNAGYADRCLLTDEECIEDQKSQYVKGLNDAWEWARKIILPYPRYEDAIPYGDLKAIFGTGDRDEVMTQFSASEAIEKIKAHEDEWNQLRVGDELIDNSNDDHMRYVITRIVSSDYVNVVNVHGSLFYLNPKNYKKTGRHFSQVEELLKQMQGEANDI